MYCCISIHQRVNMPQPAAAHSEAMCVRRTTGAVWRGHLHFPRQRLAQQKAQAGILQRACLGQCREGCHLAKCNAADIDRYNNCAMTTAQCQVSTGRVSACRTSTFSSNVGGPQTWLMQPVLTRRCCRQKYALTPAQHSSVGLWSRPLLAGQALQA
jgi:hypothetical protein